MSLIDAFVAVQLPAWPAVAGGLARLTDARRAGAVTVGAAWGAFGLAALRTARFLAPAFAGGSALAPSAGILFRVDALTVVMSVLVAFVGAVVLGFSRRYLQGDANQSRFLSWMSLTLAAVLTVVEANHLLLLLGAWTTTSLCLHRLLLFYPERAGAHFAARKKFVFSRLGDGCLLGACLALHAHYGTFAIDRILAAVAAGDTAGCRSAAWLLAGCALLKSAQFPFHSWLPDTMETPTPVSAFMHAGIINAGGFLVIRFAPVFAASASASILLVVVGTMTAAFGAVVMLAQPSVKRALAYSTIAQMGFMLLQCGLGAYGLALLHIAAHSLYKAHLFLTSGSTIGTVPRAAVPLRTPALTLGVLTGGLLVALGTVVLRVVLPMQPVAADVFALVLALALAYGVGRTWSAGGGWRTFAGAVAAAAVVALVSLSLHLGAGLLFAGVSGPTLPRSLLLAVGALFVGLFFFQALLWRTHQSAWARRVYVHALNGFYVGTTFNRWLGRLWPQQAVTV